MTDEPQTFELNTTPLVGQTGDQGEAGEQGEQGEQGDVGETGEQGHVGDTGATGPVGAHGNVQVTTRWKPSGLLFAVLLSILAFMGLLGWTSITSIQATSATQQATVRLDRQVAALRRFAETNRRINRDNNRLLYVVTRLSGTVDCDTQRTVQRVIDQLAPGHPSLLTAACRSKR